MKQCAAAIVILLFFSVFRVRDPRIQRHHDVYDDEPCGDDYFNNKSDYDDEGDYYDYDDHSCRKHRVYEQCRLRRRRT
jgi:hypothetical protein